MKRKIVLRPFKAFDANLLTGKQTLLDVDKNLWQPDAVFAQFFSENGCEFNLTVKFVEEEEQRENRKNRRTNKLSVKLMRGKFTEIVEKRIQETVNWKSGIKRENDLIKQLKQARRIRERTNIKDDFVVINIEKSETFAEQNYHKSMRNQQIRHARYASAKAVRKEQIEEKHRLNVLSLQKWDFLRQKRAEAEDNVMERLRQQSQMKALLIMAARHQFLLTILNKFEDAVNVKKR